MAETEKTLRERATDFGVTTEEKDGEKKYRIKDGTIAEYAELLGHDSAKSALKNAIEGRLNLTTFDHPLAPTARKMLVAADDAGKLEKLLKSFGLEVFEINKYDVKDKSGKATGKIQKTVSNSNLEKVCNYLATRPEFAVFMEDETPAA